MSEDKNNQSFKIYSHDQEGGQVNKDKNPSISIYDPDNPKNVICVGFKLTKMTAIPENLQYDNTLYFKEKDKNTFENEVEPTPMSEEELKKKLERHNTTIDDLKKAYCELLTEEMLKRNHL